MRQLRFYIPLSFEVNQEYDLPENTARHIVRVLRLSEGDEITMFNGDNHEYIAQLVETSKKTALVRVISAEEVNRESPLHTHLIQSLSKGDKMETTIQKAVELGVNVITPVSSERSNVSLLGAKYEKKLEKKVQHWQGVVQSACEQTGRNALPEVGAVQPLNAQLDACRASFALKLILSPHAKSCLSEIKSPPQSVILLIGPEGGFSEAEIAYAIDCGFIETKAGPRVLRTETAGPAMLSIVQMLWGDLS